MHQSESSLAERLIRQGNHDEAVSIYIRSGEILQAAKTLDAASRKQDAIRVLTRYLPKKGALDESGKTLASLLITYLIQSEDFCAAISLLLRQGDEVRAATLADRAGMKIRAALIRHDGAAPIPINAYAKRTIQDRLADGDVEAAIAFLIELNQLKHAARLAVKYEHVQQGAYILEVLHLHFQCAQCYANLGKHDDVLKHVTRIHHEHKNYRRGVRLALLAAHELGYLNDETESFVSNYFESNAENQEDAEAFIRLAELFSQKGRRDLESEALTKAKPFCQLKSKVHLRIAEIEAEVESEKLRRLEAAAIQDSSFRGAFDELRKSSVDSPDIEPQTVASPRAAETNETGEGNPRHGYISSNEHAMNQRLMLSNTDVNRIRASMPEVVDDTIRTKDITIPDASAPDVASGKTRSQHTKDTLEMDYGEQALLRHSILPGESFGQSLLPDHARKQTLKDTFSGRVSVEGLGDEDELT